MRAVAIILSILTALGAVTLIGAIGCNRTPGSGPFPIQGWIAVGMAVLAVFSTITLIIALRR